MSDTGIAEEYKALQKQASRLGSLLSALSKPRLASAEFVVDLEKAMRRLPPDPEFGEELAVLRAGLQKVVDRERAQRIERFGALEAEYIRGRRSAELEVRQLDEGRWRVGELEVRLDRTELRAQVLYNHEVVHPWTRIASPEDLVSMENKTRKRLEDVQVPLDILPKVLESALAQASRGRGELRLSSIPILTFLREVRLELLRRELGDSNPGKRLRHGEYPLWALLHNLDRYRSTLGELPENRRIGFETGSQQEQSRGLGVSLQGPGGDYRTFCYVRLPRG